MFTQDTAAPEIAFTLDMPEGEISLDCDARQLRQVLINLLKNAVEAIGMRKETDTALPDGRIDVRLHADEIRLTLEVSDNGRGLPREERERLTEPYVTTRKEGTGLGLAIANKIVEDHGGRLSLDDREGGGAVVRVALPRHRRARNENAGDSGTLTHTDGVGHGS